MVQSFQCTRIRYPIQCRIPFFSCCSGTSVSSVKGDCLHLHHFQSVKVSTLYLIIIVQYTALLLLLRHFGFFCGGGLPSSSSPPVCNGEVEYCYAISRYLDTREVCSIPIFPSGQLLDSALSVCKSSGNLTFAIFSQHLAFGVLELIEAASSFPRSEVMMYGPIHSGSSFPPFLCFSLVFSISTSTPMGRTCGWCLLSYISFWLFWAAVMLLSAFMNALTLVAKRFSICRSRPSSASSSR